MNIPPVAQFNSRNEWEIFCWKEVTRSGIIELLVTSSEKRDLIMRVAILERLAAGKSYRAIGDELFVAPQTISAVKKGFIEQLYKSYWQRSKTERKSKIYTVFPRAKKHYRVKRTKYGKLYFD